MPEVEITNMVMIQDPATGKVLVQKRVKSWPGMAFPGGHTEPGESLYDSAVREVREETGLEVQNLKACGLMYWYNDQTGEKYFTHFYKTDEYQGTLIPATDEGPVFWVAPEELAGMPLANGFREYLPIFLGQKYTEGFCCWNDGMKIDETKPNPWGIVYR